MLPFMHQRKDRPLTNPGGSRSPPQLPVMRINKVRLVCCSLLRGIAQNQDNSFSLEILVILDELSLFWTSNHGDLVSGASLLQTRLTTRIK